MGSPHHPDPPGTERSSWFSTEGTASPLGATWIPEADAFNFAIYSHHATAVKLLLFREDCVDTPHLEIEFSHLRNKSGRVWHCRVPDSKLQDVRFYAYQIQGPMEGQKYDLHAFDEEKVLTDPYAKEIFFPKNFDRLAAVEPGPNMGKAPLGVLSKNGHSFHWGDDRVRHHEHDLVIYEMHVRGFTQHPSSGVPDPRRGTFLGIIDKIPHLLDLGVTAVELMPVYQYDPQEGNYWGYMPLNFFAPHSQYATTPGNAANDFRAMVKALHRAGIEVILDVVYNHTTEGDEHGPCYNFKGIDNSSYYITTGNNAHPFANFSGTGNTLHSKNRHTVRMILDSMRHWVQEHHVDGFRFDLASIFNRRGDGSVSSSQSRLVAAIRADPVLGNTRLIAEPWDAAGLNQLGREFPGKRWFQWNGRYRDDIRRFVKGDAGLVPNMMQRIYGSDDLFPDTLSEAYHPYQSVNYVNSHDGFTLYDQVAYNEKHNWANGEENRDGHPTNFSWNCGWEGDINVPEAVVRLRLQQAKNFCCLLMLSNGTPMVRAGDEFLQTQLGNNNPFNQDNEISWLDWQRLEQFKGFYRFVRAMIAFRKSHPSLSRSRFWREDVAWYGVGPEVDFSYTSHCFAYCLHGASQGDRDLYVMLNMDWRPHTFAIQEYRSGWWAKAIDTSRNAPDDIDEVGTAPPLYSRHLTVEPRSVVVLVSTQIGTEKA